MVLATSKPEGFAVEILRHFGLYDYFDIIAGASMDESRNKKAEQRSAFFIFPEKFEYRYSIKILGGKRNDGISAGRLSYRNR